MPKSENFRVSTRKRHMEPGMDVMPMETRDIIATSRREALDTASTSEMEAVRAMRAKPRSEQDY